MIFTMGRDNRLPYASAIAKVHGKSKTPLVPSIVIGVITILLLVLNVGNQRAFFVLTSTFTGLLGLVGIGYYLVKLRGSQATVLAEHRADAVPAAVGVGDEAAGA